MLRLFGMRLFANQGNEGAEIGAGYANGGQSTAIGSHWRMDVRLVGLRVMLMLASVSIAGCAGHSTDCASGASETDCAPGTAGYEQKIQKEQDAKAVASIDDARCLSLGGDRGSPVYLECRRRATSDRQSLSH